MDDRWFRLGDHGRYPAQSNATHLVSWMNRNVICKLHRRFVMAFCFATMGVYAMTFLGFIALRDLLGFSSESIALPTIAAAVLLSGILGMACYCLIKVRYFITCPKCNNKLQLGWWIRCSTLTCRNTACRHSVQCDIGF